MHPNGFGCTNSLINGMGCICVGIALKYDMVSDTYPWLCSSPLTFFKSNLFYSETEDSRGE